ncbi:hypothetical protein T484DRAFT_1923396 [Baffinella frigidus]|nr:hypothetical protein T484DRAFT_1923396 [Cryptophyta sp. CCMP2293]
MAGGGGLTGSLMFLSNLVPAGGAPDSVAPASPADDAHNYKKLMHPEIHLIELLRKEAVPSRITFYLRMLEMDPNSDGILSEDEINRGAFTVFIENQKMVFASYMTNISIVSGLLAFALFSILTTSNPEPSGLVLDELITDAGIQMLLFFYVFLFQVAGLFAIGSMFTSIIWLIQVLGQTPTNEDGVYCMINNNVIIPIGLLLFSAIFTLIGEQCYIFLQYGWYIGLRTAIVCSVMVVPWVILHVSGLLAVSKNLKKRAALRVALYDGNKATLREGHPWVFPSEVVVSLNVRGEAVDTSLATVMEGARQGGEVFRRICGSLLVPGWEAYAAGEGVPEHEAERATEKTEFVDTNPRVFEVVLDYLQSGELPSADTHTLENVRAWAARMGMEALQRTCQDSSKRENARVLSVTPGRMEY